MNSLFLTILLLVIGQFLFINHLTHNFLASYIQVRMKRDKGVMVTVFGKRGMYYRPGVFTEGFIRYKVSRKERAMLPVRDAGMFRALGINFVMTREGSDEVLSPEFRGVIGGDPEDTDQLFVRALHKPSISSTQDRLVMLGMIVIVALLAVVLYKVLTIQGVVEGLQAAQAAGTAITGGNV